MSTTVGDLLQIKGTKVEAISPTATIHVSRVVSVVPAAPVEESLRARSWAT